MNWLARLGAKGRPAGDELARCGACRFFTNDALGLEAAIPGLRSLGSATSSVRSDDGLCALHDQYLGARRCCADFQEREALGADPDRG